MKPRFPRLCDVVVLVSRPDRATRPTRPFAASCTIVDAPDVGGASTARPGRAARLVALAYGAVLGAVAVLGALGVAAEPVEDPFQTLAAWDYGHSRQPLAQIEALIRQTAPADRQKIETRLLEVLKSDQTPPAAKRYICRWLAVVGSDACVPAVAALLADPDLAHPARMALESLAAPAAATALRDSLATLRGDRLLGVLSSVGARRDPLAVDALARLTSADDASVACGAMVALGQIGTDHAARVLSGLQPPAALRTAQAEALVSAAHRLASSDKRDAAADIYQRLEDPSLPRPIRVAALKGLLATLPSAAAVPRFITAVQGDDAALRQAALTTYADAANRPLKDAVAAQLPTMAPAGQRLLLTILADDPDVTCRSAVLHVVESATDADICASAARCLALHGTAADVALMARLAHAEPANVAEAARDALAGMRGSEIDPALVRIVASGTEADRTVALDTLAARRAESALPMLVDLARSSDVALATQVVRALSSLGNSGQLDAVADVLVRTADDGLRGAAAQAIRAICSRTEDKAAAAAPLVAALNRAAAPTARIAILQQLPYAADEAALKAVRDALRQVDTAVADAAVRALVAWPNAAAVPALIELAKTTDQASYGVLCLRDGCLRLAQQKTLPLAQRLEIYRGVLAAARRPDERGQAIAGLADVPTIGALDLLRATVQDPELRREAMAAIVRLARPLAAVYHEQTLAALQELKAQTDDEQVNRDLDAAIRAVENVGQSPDGFIVAWLLAGPYAQPDKNGRELFDIAFPPEQSETAADVEWRPVAVAADRASGLIELNKILDGNDRAAYLATRLTVDRELAATLELGSDDGVKVWLNGHVVHANNAIRPCTPGQDKVAIKLRPGGNRLLLKVTQSGGEWSACCRLTDAGGKPLDGVIVNPAPAAAPAAP